MDRLFPLKIIVCLNNVTMKIKIYYLRIHKSEFYLICIRVLYEFQKI